MRLIDADAVLKWFAEYWAMQKKLKRPSKQQRAIYMSMRTMVNSFKTEDAVPVIRCKDCKHWDGYYCHEKWWGNGYGNYYPPIKDEDGFCDWAERDEEHDRQR